MPEIENVHGDVSNLCCFSIFSFIVNYMKTGGWILMILFGNDVKLIFL